jgi:3-hydroxy-9,10-secoandrosta-1,3,5(10)-triene-9,17-dione monooxygenase reductase component
MDHLSLLKPQPLGEEQYPANGPVGAGHPGPAPTGDALRLLMRRIAEPVVVVTGRDQEHRPWGKTISTFTSVSLDPPLALFCPSRTSRTWTAIASVGEVVVNVLAADQQALAEAFARSGWRFPRRVAHRTTPSGLPVLDGCLATAYCTVTAVHAGGDHDVVLARVDEVCLHRSGPPLTYWRGTYASAHSVEESR